jgi:ribose 5-phosphate isomerase A
VAGSKAIVAPASAADLEALGRAAAKLVRAGQVIGLGTGKAASAFIRALAEDKVRISGVATSKASEDLARALGIRTVQLADVSRIDIDFDGADEVDARLNLIKGYGGALVREKIVAASSRRFVVLVGAEKIVPYLGARGSLPVEIIPFAARLALNEIKAMGMRASVRLDGAIPFVSDNGNFIVDCAVGRIRNPARLDRDLLAIPGVVGTGLFVAMATTAMIANVGGAITTLRAPR